MYGKSRLKALELFDVDSREGLAKLKTLAVRRGLWFKVLNALERAVVDLTIKVVERVRSSTLRSVLKSIASKVMEVLKARAFKERAVAIGRVLVERLVRIAEKLGCKGAGEWARDPGFVMYLGVSWLNTSPVFRCPL
jgi:predicted AAA+ superfamily ATPase